MVRPHVIAVRCKPRLWPAEGAAGRGTKRTTEKDDDAGQLARSARGDAAG
ncbi:MAG: hypothetical protein QOC98_48 [Frankiaceae bacterium]|nr:hypothetical protein [Frankiaceae bacterium]